MFFKWIHCISLLVLISFVTNTTLPSLVSAGDNNSGSNSISNIIQQEKRNEDFKTNLEAEAQKNREALRSLSPEGLARALSNSAQQTLLFFDQANELLSPHSVYRQSPIVEEKREREIQITRNLLMASHSLPVISTDNELAETTDGIRASIKKHKKLAVFFFFLSSLFALSAHTSANLSSEGLSGMHWASVERDKSLGEKNQPHPLIKSKESRDQYVDEKMSVVAAPLFRALYEEELANAQVYAEKERSKRGWVVQPENKNLNQEHQKWRGTITIGIFGSAIFSMAFIVLAGAMLDAISGKKRDIKSLEKTKLSKEEAEIFEKEYFSKLRERFPEVPHDYALAVRWLLKKVSDQVALIEAIGIKVDPTEKQLMRVAIDLVQSLESTSVKKTCEKSLLAKEFGESSDRDARAEDEVLSAEATQNVTSQNKLIR